MPFRLMLNVLNVGDGACTVISNRAGERLVLDCGSWRSSGTPQAQILTQALGRRLSTVSTLVVSHFDGDHWKGLKALPAVAPRAHLPQRVAIRYPGLPSIGRETTAAFMALRTIAEGVSLDAQDLVSAWKPVSEVDAQPIFAGEQLTLGDEPFDIVWPPRILPESWSKAARRTLEELSALAEEVPALKRALDEAYENAWSGGVNNESFDEGTVTESGQLGEQLPGVLEHEEKDGYLAGLDDTQRAQIEADVAWDLAANGVCGETPWQKRPEWVEPRDTYEGSVKDRFDMGAGPGGWALGRMAPEFPVDEESTSEPRSGLGQTGHTELFGPDWAVTDHREQLRGLARRLGVLNNHLSLVMVHQEAGFVALGDVKGWSLRRVSDELHKIQSFYTVALAPHHGTERMPPDFPRVRQCVLQCGPSHVLRSDRHVRSHRCASFFATEVSGNLHRWV